MLFRRMYVSPRSQLSCIPPSPPTRVWRESRGSIHIVWWSVFRPTSYVGEFGMFSNVAPPSSLLKIVTPSSHTRLSLVGSMYGALKYIGRGFERLILRQVVPASSLRYVPLSVACSTSAMSTCGFDRAMARAMRPLSPAGMPFSTFFHVAPPSVVL